MDGDGDDDFAFGGGGEFGFLGELLVLGGGGGVADAEAIFDFGVVDPFPVDALGLAFASGRAPAAGKLSIRDR